MGWPSKFENELERQFGYVESAVRVASGKIGVNLTADLIERIQRAAADTQAFASHYLRQLPYKLSEFEEKIDWLKFENEMNDDESKAEIHSLRKQVEGFKKALSELRHENEIVLKQRNLLKNELGRWVIRLPTEYKDLDASLRREKRLSQIASRSD